MYSQVSILRHHLYKAVEFGANFREMCRRLKVTPEILANGEDLLPFSLLPENDFWTHALELTGDPCLGLHMGQKPDKYHSFGMLGLLAGSSGTVGEALQAVSRFNDTLTGVFTFSLRHSADGAVFEMTPHPLWEESIPDSARQAVDMSLSSWMCQLHELATRKIYPLQTLLRGPRRFEEEYRKIVNGPVLFNQEKNCLIFDAKDLEVPLLNYDQTLHAVFEQLLLEKRKNLETKKSMANKVRHLLLTTFHGQPVHIDLVASSLFMTTRTLQRKLADESTTYREICNDMRKGLAESLLKGGTRNKTQVAGILGYTDVSSLNKAIKSWNG